VVPVEHPGQGVAEVAQKVPAVRDLDGLGRAAANAVGVSTGAVTRDDVDAGMVVQPSPDRLRLAVGQDINGTVALQIDDERAVALSSTPSPVVDAVAGVGAAGNGAVRIRRSSVSPLAGMASRDARRAPASPPALKATWHCASARRAVRRTRGRATAGRRSEDAARALGSRTPEAPDLQVELADTALPRQVAEAAEISAVDTARRAPAKGA